MKRAFLVFVISFLISFSFPGLALSHGEGPPYVLINNKYADTNPFLAFNAYPDLFPSGLDVAPDEKYLVNQSIEFAIDENNFPYPFLFDPESSTQVEIPAVYTWVFPDGERIGKNVTYAFSKPGTYVISLNISHPPLQNEKQEYDTIELTIVPHKDYKLPKAVIRIDEKTITDPEEQILPASSRKTMQFDASASTGSDLKYLWALGDSTTSKDKTLSHKFSDDYYLLFPVLRVTDKNGITSDAYVLLDFSLKEKNWFTRLLDAFFALFQRK